jgi:hypothetical protein
MKRLTTALAALAITLSAAACAAAPPATSPAGCYEEIHPTFVVHAYYPTPTVHTTPGRIIPAYVCLHGHPLPPPAGN